MSREEHHGRTRSGLKLGVITASDTRRPETDTSGRLICEMFEGAGHKVVYYEVVPDSSERIREAINTNLPHLDAVVVCGGTGIAARDVTVETVRALLDREIEGFGELFRMLSYQEIGPRAFLSSATAGVSGGKLVVALPGSTGACKLAMERLLLPEIGHIAYLLDL